MQVLEHERDRALAAEPVDQPEQGLEQPRLRRPLRLAALAELGE